MGACFQSMTLDGKLTRKEVEAKFESAQADDRYENGHSYSGGFGMASGLTFVGKTFNTEDAANEYLQETAQKWENALAVTFTKDGAAHWMIGAWCSS